MEKKENQNLENQVLRKNALEAQVNSNSNNDDDDNDNMYTCMYIIVYIYYWDMSTSLRGCLSSGLSLFGTPYTVPLRDSSPCSGIYTQPTQRYHWCPPPSPWIIWILTSSLVLMKAFFSSSSTTTRYCECYIYGPLRLPSQRGGGWPQRPIRWYSKRWHCVIRLTKNAMFIGWLLYIHLYNDYETRRPKWNTWLLDVFWFLNTSRKRSWAEFADARACRCERWLPQIEWLNLPARQWEFPFEWRF